MQVVKPPIHFQGDNLGLHLGKSENGVYFALVCGRCEFKIWFLDESCCPMAWVLKHEADLTGWLLSHDIDEQQEVRGPWTLRDITFHYNRAMRWSYKEDDDREVPVEEMFEWDSEEEKLESYTKSDEDEGQSYCGYINILGFHPYKEIIFLGERSRRGLAYHFINNSVKVQDLGNLYPTGYDGFLSNEEFIEQCFPYTPSWIMDPTSKK